MYPQVTDSVREVFEIPKIDSLGIFLRDVRDSKDSIQIPKKYIMCI